MFLIVIFWTHRAKEGGHLSLVPPLTLLSGRQVHCLALATSAAGMRGDSGGARARGEATPLSSAHLLAPVADGEITGTATVRPQKREAGTFSLWYVKVRNVITAVKSSAGHVHISFVSRLCSCGDLLVERRQEVQVNCWLTINHKLVTAPRTRCQSAVEAEEPF